MTSLIGRRELIGEVDRLMAGGISVLLVGPPGAGKTALIDAIGRRRSCEAVDPFENLSRAGAARLRRRLDAGVVMIGAARTLDRRRMGSVNRVRWRFRVVRVPPLALAEMRELIGRALADAMPTDAAVERWVRQLSRAADGIPGRGHAFAQAGISYWRRSGALPTPEWTVVETLTIGLIGARP